MDINNELVFLITSMGRYILYIFVLKGMLNSTIVTTNNQYCNNT